MPALLTCLEMATIAGNINSKSKGRTLGGKRNLSSNGGSVPFVVLVGIGGALGAIARYWVNGLAVTHFGSSLMGTFFANASGSFVLGFLVGILSSNPTWAPETRIFLAVGFLGSYTTFSTLTVATVQLLQKGDVSTAAINLVTSVVVGLIAAITGLLIGKAL